MHHFPVARGTTDGDMGADLPVTELGDDVGVTDIQAGGNHTCVVLSDYSVKCAHSCISTSTP